MNPLVSVIIPTKNSAKTLEICLNSLEKQSYRNIEIIIIDNFSTDATQIIARRYTDRVYEYGPERTYQKNHGIEKAKGEYICFIDSDMELSGEVIRECVLLYSESEDIGGICIPEVTVGEGWLARIRAYERGFYAHTSIESARFFLREDVLAVGGFETDIVFFEESLLPQKIESRRGKPTSSRIEAFISHHEGSTSLMSWLAKKYYYGKSLMAYKKKGKEIGLPEVSANQIGILSRYMIFLGNRRFYQKPLLALAVLVLKTLEFSAGALGLCFTYLKTKK